MFKSSKNKHSKEQARISESSVVNQSLNLLSGAPVVGEEGGSHTSTGSDCSSTLSRLTVPMQMNFLPMEILTRRVMFP